MIAVERFKQEGNKFYSNKEYEKAEIEYQKALLQFDYTFPDTEAEEKKMQTLQEVCHTNMALVKFHMKDYKESILQCDMALKVNKNAMKARFRKACAFLELLDYEKVKQQIEEALKINPEAKEFVELGQKVEKEVENYKLKQEKMAKKMFSDQKV